jgi:putative transposase
MEVAPGMYHVYARGNDRRRLFLDDDDRHWYLRKLGAVTVHRRWRTMSYCLMNNHVHTLIETIEPNLGRGMHGLQGGYAQRFNKRHGTTGHVFERRFGCVPITSDEQFMTAASYIAHNPVEAFLTATASAWRWSSHAAMAGVAEMPSWLAADRLLSIYAGLGGDPLEAYTRHVTGRAEAMAPAVAAAGEAPPGAEAA